MSKLLRVLNKLYTTWIYGILLVGNLSFLVCITWTLHDSFVVMRAINKVKLEYPQLGLNEYGNTTTEINKLEHMPFKYTDGNTVFYKDLAEFNSKDKYVMQYTQSLRKAGFGVSTSKWSRSIYTQELTWGDSDFSNFWTGLLISTYWILGSALMVVLSASVRRWLIWLSK